MHEVGGARFGRQADVHVGQLRGFLPLRRDAAEFERDAHHERCKHSVAQLFPLTANKRAAPAGPWCRRYGSATSREYCLTYRHSQPRPARPRRLRARPVVRPVLFVGLLNYLQTRAVGFRGVERRCDLTQGAQQRAGTGG